MKARRPDQVGVSYAQTIPALHAQLHRRLDAAGITEVQQRRLYAGVATFIAVYHQAVRPAVKLPGKAIKSLGRALDRAPPRQLWPLLAAARQDVGPEASLAQFRGILRVLEHASAQRTSAPDLIRARGLLLEAVLEYGGPCGIELSSAPGSLFIAIATAAYEIAGVPVDSPRNDVRKYRAALAAKSGQTGTRNSAGLTTTTRSVGAKVVAVDTQRQSAHRDDQPQQPKPRRRSKAPRPA